MNKIIKMATVVACASAVLGIAGCGGAKTPDAVALEVLTAVQKGKASPEFLAKNCTATAAQMLTAFGAMCTEALKGATFTVVDTKINGDKAVVTIKQEGGEKPSTEKEDMVLVDGEWKLDMRKEDGKKETKN